MTYDVATVAKAGGRILVGEFEDLTEAISLALDFADRIDEVKDQASVERVEIRRFDSLEISIYATGRRNRRASGVP